MGLRRKKKNNMGLAALAGETAKMAKTMMVLDKTEASLEKELERDEKRSVPTSKIGKMRRKGEHMLHAKYILLAIVILNVVDCLLVLGELMLDIKYVTDLLTKEYERSEEFIGTMKGLYPARLGYLQPTDIEILEQELTVAHITWDYPSNSGNQTGSGGNGVNSVLNSTNTRRRRASGSVHETYGNRTVFHTDQRHSLEEDIAHALHKASISILGILVVETFFKIFCYGKAMLEHRLECFDSFIVVASFIVDLVFLKGLQQFTVQEFVLILAFMVPWRIIRVVNSLVVAIMDHEHFRLKILYKQKKKVSQELKEAKDEIKCLEACINALEQLCASAGVPDTHIKAKLNMYRKVKAKGNALGAMSNFAIGGVAMEKSFTNGIMPKTDVVITVENDNTKTADKLNHLLNGDNTNPNLLSPHTVVTTKDPDERPRSRSNIEYTEHNKKSEQDALVRMLAENSAGFIATINKDDYELRQGMLKAKMDQEMEAKEQEKRNENSETNIDRRDSPNKPDDKSDSNSGNGHDNPVSQL